MVQQGQFLERPTLIPVGDVVMEGLSHRGDKRPGVLILPPLPEEGGMDHVVANELAWATAHNGYPSLRFNYRGVGASQGARGADPVADAEAALVVLRENTDTTTALVVSIGASAPVAVALLRRHPALSGLVMVNPAGIEPAGLVQLSVRPVAVIAEHDPRLPRAAWAAALAEAGGSLEVISGTGPTYTRHLPEVGKVVVRLLQELGP